MKLSACEHAEIKNGAVLVISCQGAHKCGGYIRVPFSPPIGNNPEPTPTPRGVVWRRESGDTLDTLTLSPSIDADVCGHFHIKNGEVC